MGIPRVETEQIYKLVKRLENFYAQHNALVNEARNLDIRYGYVISGLDAAITYDGFLGTYNDTDLAVVSGMFIGTREYGPVVSGWRAAYIGEA